jgi:hypothetical protein
MVDREGSRQIYASGEMGVAMALAATLTASGCFAVLVVRAPLLGLMSHPRASLVVAIFGAVLAATVVLFQIAVPLTFGGTSSLWPPLIVTDYFLAMGHNLMGGEYPFFWSPLWVFRVGSLTPLIPAGAAVALAAGYSVRMYARRTAVVTVAMASCLLLAYAAAGAYTATVIWGGIAL